MDNTITNYDGSVLDNQRHGNNSKEFNLKKSLIFVEVTVSNIMIVKKHT